MIYLKSALALFVVVWTAWAGQQTENGVVFYDDINALTNLKTMPIKSWAYLVIEFERS